MLIWLWRFLWELQSRLHSLEKIEWENVALGFLILPFVIETTKTQQWTVSTAQKDFQRCVASRGCHTKEWTMWKNKFLIACCRGGFQAWCRYCWSHLLFSIQLVIMMSWCIVNQSSRVHRVHLSISLPVPAHRADDGNIGTVCCHSILDVSPNSQRCFS